jgi:hypothetical protein
MLNLNEELLLNLNIKAQNLSDVIESKHFFYNYKEFLESDAFYKLQYGETKRDVMYKIKNPFNSSKNIIITNGFTYLHNSYCEFIDK